MGGRSKSHDMFNIQTGDPTYGSPWCSGSVCGSCHAGSRQAIFEDPAQMLFSLGNFPDSLVIPFSAIPRALCCLAIIFLLLQEQEASICQQSINACSLQARNCASFFQTKHLMQSLKQPIYSWHTYEDLGLNVICVVRGTASNQRSPDKRFAAVSPIATPFS